jgi:hypothetical protein
VQDGNVIIKYLWPFTLGDEGNTLRVLGDMILVAALGTKGDEVTGEWGKLYIEFRGLSRSPDIMVTKSMRL